MAIFSACARVARVLPILAVIFLTAFALGIADDDDQGKVEVFVTSNDGTPIAGATVTLSASGIALSRRTDAEGEAEFKHFAGGTYVLHATAPGYQTISQRTVTISGERPRLRVQLSRATTNSLVVIGQVQASSGETVSTASAPTISMSAQQAAAAGVTSVAPMVWSQLSTTPVLPLGGGSNATEAFAVRGPDPTETLVDVDGHHDE